MYSKEHAGVSAAVSLLLLAPVLDQIHPLAYLPFIVYAVFLGVFIDLDHFIIARMNTGHWHHLTSVLAKGWHHLSQSAAQRDMHRLGIMVKALFIDQEEMMDGAGKEDKFILQRLLSHHIILGYMTLLTLFINHYLAIFTSIILYTHIVCDLLRDNNIV